MHRTWTVAALLSLCCLPLAWAMAEEAEKKPDPAKADEAALQGGWVALMGEPKPDDEVLMVVEGNRVTLTVAGHGPRIKGTVTLKPAATPKQVDVVIAEAGNPDTVGKTSLGIYKLDVDGTWTLAANAPGVAARPEKFEPTDQTKVFVFRKWQPGMALPGNPPELKVLERRIGTWVTEVVVQPGPWAPKGDQYTGTETIEWVLGGRFQQSRATNRPARPDGLFLTTYDAQRKAFRGWFHSDEGYSHEWTTHWDEATQTFRGTSEAPDGMRATSEWRFTGPDTTENHVVVKNADGQVMFDMTAKSKRKAEPEPPKAPAPR
jgi:uncharacterized protein (TIGR03067 family)